uniref:NADH-ubiquinone oxidoreductase chain 3 n=1 Tax=Forcipomyia makanensis TaxID=2590746 RepID=A0A513X8U8_9DIPT|nr:NADH dehydrogenase subunit 3 [Forcipomyia makanensis]
MYMISLLTMIILLISSIVMILASLLSKKPLFDREKMSPFECGFEPFNSSRLPFSIRFFLIAIIFLIFDVEIALMFPMINIMKINEINIWTYTSITFIIILILGLYHEWNQGALKWNN